MEEVRKLLREYGVFVQGSYVLDILFGTKFARDMDVFVAKGSQFPELPFDIRMHTIEIDAIPKAFLGVYNVDRYFLIFSPGKPEGEIIHPLNYPTKPEKLFLISARQLAVADVVRGIKFFIRYNLEPIQETKKVWLSAMEKIFGDQARKLLSFQSEKEVKDYILFVLREGTNELERKRVLQELKKYCPKL